MREGATAARIQKAYREWRDSAAAAAAAAPAARAPQGGRPVPSQGLSQEAIEAARQGRQTFGTFGYPSVRREPEQFDISMGDPAVEMEDDTLPQAKRLSDELFNNIVERYSQLSLDELKERYKTILGKSDEDCKDAIQKI